jgi:hypothetical protein
MNVWIYVFLHHNMLDKDQEVIAAVLKPFIKKKG